ncbi:hypothetical protein CEXT_48491 [Caerostris extrusa]|uniref:Uncharacterized protein n=1 Tax=Caerostris extrusa TaxID=172846 RepID=A0AAV4N4N1_CAEEX|nr:hypothetical protein CEXT_48491 [Caerostris extrusa]
MNEIEPFSAFLLESVSTSEEQKQLEVKYLPTKLSLVWGMGGLIKPLRDEEVRVIGYFRAPPPRARRVEGLSTQSLALRLRPPATFQGVLHRKQLAGRHMAKCRQDDLKNNNNNKHTQRDRLQMKRSVCADPRRRVSGRGEDKNGNRIARTGIPGMSNK